MFSKNRRKSQTDELQEGAALSPFAPAVSAPSHSSWPSAGNPWQEAHASYRQAGVESSMGQSALAFAPASATGTAVLPLADRSLTEVHTGQLTIDVDDMQQENLPLRQPLVIKGSGKRRTGPIIPPSHPSRKRRALVSSVITCLCIILTVAAASIVVPVDKQGSAAGLLGIFRNPTINLVNEKNSNSAAITSQMATQVAQTDGYDPYAHLSNVPAYATGSTLNRFYWGQCTYWANLRYHEVSGVWVPWLGDAYQWYGQAIAAGWHTSDRPNPNGYSIMVLAGYVQGSLTYYGHVAVVEHDNGDGSVVVSQMHWPVLGQVTYMTFYYPVAGTHFIWAP